MQATTDSQSNLVKHRGQNQFETILRLPPSAVGSGQADRLESPKTKPGQSCRIESSRAHALSVPGSKPTTPAAAVEASSSRSVGESDLADMTSSPAYPTSWAAAQRSTVRDGKSIAQWCRRYFCIGGERDNGTVALWWRKNHLNAGTRDRMAKEIDVSRVGCVACHIVGCGA